MQKEPFIIAHAKSKETPHCRANPAHYASVSQEGIPLEWIFSGYREIQKPQRKCALIAYERLQKLSGFGSYDEFTDAHRKWVESFLEDRDCVREGKWTQSIATCPVKSICFI